MSTDIRDDETVNQALARLGLTKHWLGWWDYEIRDGERVVFRGDAYETGRWLAAGRPAQVPA